MTTASTTSTGAWDMSQALLFFFSQHQPLAQALLRIQGPWIFLLTPPPQIPGPLWMITGSTACTTSRLPPSATTSKPQQATVLKPTWSDFPGFLFCIYHCLYYISLLHLLYLNSLFFNFEKSSWFKPRKDKTNSKKLATQLEKGEVHQENVVA